ncbi:Patatin-like phospholipase domain-containing protein 2 [Halotydeus destructor]|nr:Patatin-like phospholipase domain-containing protein 2 [Halotydeus destructor]
MESPADCTSTCFPSDKINLSFAGCGFNGIYHVGVASCFREYCPQVGFNKISGASIGAIAAAAMACQIPLGNSASDILKVAIKARSRVLGPFHPTFDVNRIMRDAMDSALPVDAHKRVNGRLHISVTRVSDGKNVILSQFDSREDLIQAIVCSCFIPFFSGVFPPKFHGVAYMDGGFSDNLLVLDDYTATVSPFSGECDICPQDDTFNILQINFANTSIAVSPNNVYRVTRILFPPHPEVMSKMCQQGFDDALRFLQRHNKISCMRCVAIETSFVVAESEQLKDQLEDPVSDEGTSDSGYEHAYDDCSDCRARREMAVLESLPDPVARAIQDACDQVNKGVVNWIFKHRPVKVLSVLTLPAVLPFDITIVVLLKLWRSLPWIQEEMKHSFDNLVLAAKKVISKMDYDRHLYSAKFSCQLAVTEFDYSPRESLQSCTPPPSASRPSPRRKSSMMFPQSPIQRTKKVEKSHSFGGRRISSVEDITARRNDLNSRRNMQRKSYAGSEFILNSSGRRPASMVDNFGCKPPERVISKMNFGFTFDLSNADTTTASTRSLHNAQSGDSPDSYYVENSESDVPPDVLRTLKNLSEDNHSAKEISAVALANRAMNLDKQCLGRSRTDLTSEDGCTEDSFDKILEATCHQEALMAFHYMDENNRVKITEIFNIPDDPGMNQDELTEAW